MERFTMPDELAVELCGRLGVAVPTCVDEAFAALGDTPAALDIAVRAGLVELADVGTTRWAVRPKARP